MWPRDAFVGQKVVCVTPCWVPQDDRLDYSGPLPVGDRVYEITAVGVIENGIGIALAGFDKETGFLAEYFRPVDPASKRADRGMQALYDIASRKHQPIDTPEPSEAVTHYRKPAFQKGR